MLLPKNCVNLIQHRSMCLGHVRGKVDEIYDNFIRHKDDLMMNNIALSRAKSK